MVTEPVWLWVASPVDLASHAHHASPHRPFVSATDIVYEYNIRIVQGDRRLRRLEPGTDRQIAIARESLHEAAAGRIRDMIVKGELAPATRLQERVLCEMLEISRTPLREALRVLATEGLIRILPNRGAIVHRMSVEEVLDTFQVIGILDALAGELAVERMTPAELAELERLHERMRDRFEAGDLLGYFKLNQEIHRGLIRMAKNPVLERQLQALNARVQPFRYSVNIRAESWRRSMRDHERIMACLRRRDGTRLAQVLRQHLPRKADVVRHAFASAAPQPPSETAALGRKRMPRHNASNSEKLIPA
jgi:DNA-binding GntR family transcriptional regulator